MFWDEESECASAALPTVAEEGDERDDDDDEGSEREEEEEETDERQAPGGLTRQLGLPPVQREPLHWRVVRPAKYSRTRLGGAASADADADSRRGAAAAPVGGAGNRGDGVLSSFRAGDVGVPLQVVGLTSRRGRADASAMIGTSVGASVGTNTTASSLSDKTDGSGGSSSSSSSFLDAMTAVKTVGFALSSSAAGAKVGKASTLPSHRRGTTRRGGNLGFRRALSERHWNRTMLVVSSAAIVGASLSLLTLPGSSRRGPAPGTRAGAGGASRGLREFRRSSPLSYLDRYPFTNFAETSSLVDRESEVAYYWQIPRSGGTTFKHVLGSCLDLVQASRTAKDHCDVEKDELELCETKFGRFVNVDPSDDPGIRRGRELGVVRSGMVDVVVSSRFLHSAGLFDPDEDVGTDGGEKNGGKISDGHGRGHGRGRAFTVLRHPVDRSLSTFRYLQRATWERNYNPEFAALSVTQWTQRPDTATNWMVRWLTGKNHEAALTEGDLEFAEEVLRRKFLVLLTEDLRMGAERLIRYMGWDTTLSQRRCAWGAATKAAAQNRGVDAAAAAGDGAGLDAGSATVEEDSEDYRALASINDLDIKLYEYAQELYKEQWRIIFMDGEALKIRGADTDAAAAVGTNQGVAAAAANLAAAFEAGKGHGNVREGMPSTAEALARAQATAQARAGAEAEKDDESAPTEKAEAEEAAARGFGRALKKKKDDENARAEKAEAEEAAAGPRADRESLPPPPEMARLASRFSPLEDADLDLDLGLREDEKDVEPKKGAEDKEAPSGDNKDPVVNKGELPVPPAMAQLAAAFGSNMKDGPEGTDQNDDMVYATIEDRDDLMATEDGDKSEDEAPKREDRGELPVPPEMARLAAAFEKRR